MKRKNEKPLMVIGDERNIPDHVRMMMDRLPKSVTSKKAKKKALGNMIVKDYGSSVLNQDLFKKRENHSVKAPPLNSVLDDRDSSFRHRGYSNRRNIMSREEITQITKTKEIASAVFNDRVNTFSKDMNGNHIRKGKSVRRNGTRFTDEEINLAQTKYRHIYNREIDKLTQSDIIADKEGESLLIQKLYEALSLELNKQKGSQRHERDL